MTQKEIAERLSISRPTVTLALSGSDRVNAETRRKVEEMAKKLNYQPNQASRILSTKKSNSIGILVASLSNPHFGEMSELLFQKLKKHGYSSIFAIDIDSKDYCTLLDEMKSRCVDGIISYFHPYQQDKLLELEKAGLPVVVFNGTRACRLDFVGIDYFLLGFKATNHLLNCGRTRIAWLGLCSDDRYAGYKQALQGHNIQPDPALSIEICAKAEDGYTAMTQLLRDKKNNLPDAVYCHNDLVAIGAMDAVVKYGLKVPEDISFVGTDNIVLGKYSNPNLTTIDLERNEIAEKTVDIILDKIAKKNKISDYSTIVEPDLVIRDSCGYNNLMNKEAEI